MPPRRPMVKINQGRQGERRKHRVGDGCRRPALVAPGGRVASDDAGVALCGNRCGAGGAGGGPRPRLGPARHPLPRFGRRHDVVACLGPPLSGQSEHARRPGAGVRAALRRQQAEGNRPEPELPYEWVVAVGSLSLRLWRHIVDFTGLVGQLILDIVLVARAPREGPWRETSANLYKSGVRAMPVTARWSASSSASCCPTCRRCS